MDMQRVKKKKWREVEEGILLIRNDQKQRDDTGATRTKSMPTNTEWHLDTMLSEDLADSNNINEFSTIE